MDQTLVVVLGAGASISAGLPSTAGLTTLVDDAIPGKTSAGWTWPIGEGPPPGQTISAAFAMTLRAVVKAHFQNQTLPQGYQFENLLGAVEELEDYVRRQTFLSKLTGLPGGLTVLDDALMVTTTRNYLVEAIHRHVGEAASRPEVRTHAAAVQLRRMLQRFAKRFRLVVIDLNYDDIVDEADLRWADGYTRSLGDAFIFDPEQWIRDVSDYGRNLLVHLHGSVRFGNHPSDVPWTSTPEQPAKYASYDIAKRHISVSSQARADGRSYSAPYVISGISKAPKMVYNMRPYGYYLSALSHLVPVSHALLCIGYGWGDPHVNTLLDEFMTQRPDAPAVVVTRREGTDIGENMQASEQYLQRLAQAAWFSLNSWAYAGAPGRKTSWVGGRLRLFPYGFPLSEHGVNAVIKHLVGLAPTTRA
jgi:hypothetical protein